MSYCITQDSRKSADIMYNIFTYLYICKVYTLQFFCFFSQLYTVARLTPSSLAVLATL